MCNKLDEIIQSLNISWFSLGRNNYITQETFENLLKVDKAINKILKINETNLLFSDKKFNEKLLNLE